MAKSLTPYRILIVDDDPGLRDLLNEALSIDYEVILAQDGGEAYDKALLFMPDMIVLDVQMPGHDGIWACEKIRKNAETQHIPILILSSRRETNEKLDAYAVGADDYLEKPFVVDELMAKIQAKTRRLDEHRTRNLQHGNLRLIPERMELEVGEGRVALSVLEVNLLAYFLTHPETILTRKQILSNVWKDVSVSGRTVDAHIVSLRRKMSPGDYAIETAYGAGYILKKKITP